jgi:hypothetical protein
MWVMEQPNIVAPWLSLKGLPMSQLQSTQKSATVVLKKVQLQRVAYFWQKSAITLFYEKSATDAYFLGWLRNKNFSGACYLANP